MSGPSWSHIRVTLASNRPITAYGGIRLSDEMLDQVVASCLSGETVLNFYHDSSRNAEHKYVSVEILEADDGFKDVWATIAVESKAIAQFEKERVETGGPGGMSLVISTPLQELQSLVTNSEYRMKVSADASYFDAEDIVNASSLLTASGDVEAELLYQFSAEPACRIVVEVIRVRDEAGSWPDVVAFLSPIAGAALVGALRFFLERRKKSVQPGRSEPTIIELKRVVDPDGTQSEIRRITTDDPAVVERSIESLVERIDEGEAFLDWNDDERWWRNQ
jgi:hypothetical protein